MDFGATCTIGGPSERSVFTSRTFYAAVVLSAAAAVFSIAGLCQESAQTNSTPPANLRLDFKPLATLNGMPDGFIFSLVNETDHDVRLPNPTIQCPDLRQGTVGLGVEFHPLHRGDSMSGGGCALDRMDAAPSILVRLESWKTLHAGDAMTLKAERGVLYYSDQKPGRYEFWATYEPPYIEKIDQQLLLGSGIDFPATKLVSSRLSFEKRPEP